MATNTEIAAQLRDKLQEVAALLLAARELAKKIPCEDTDLFVPETIVTRLWSLTEIARSDIEEYFLRTDVR